MIRRMKKVNKNSLKTSRNLKITVMISKCRDKQIKNKTVITMKEGNGKLKLNELS